MMQPFDFSAERLAPVFDEERRTLTLHLSEQTLKTARAGLVSSPYDRRQTETLESVFTDGGTVAQSHGPINLLGWIGMIVYDSLDEYNREVLMTITELVLIATGADMEWIYDRANEIDMAEQALAEIDEMTEGS